MPVLLEVNLVAVAPETLHHLVYLTFKLAMTQPFKVVWDWLENH